jgi:hypothetical protein
MRYALVATALLAGCPAPRSGTIAEAPSRKLGSLVNDSAAPIAIDVLQSGARIRCDAIRPEEEAMVLAAVFDHPETGDRRAHLEIPAKSSVDLAHGTDCAAVRIGAWHALVHANDRLVLEKQTLSGPHVHPQVPPPPKCAIEPLFFTPHMATLMDREWRVDAIGQKGSCLAIDVSSGELHDGWKLCAPPGSWPFEASATVKPYSHGTGLSFLGKDRNLVLEQPILPLTDEGDVTIHVSAERAGAPCIVPPTFDIALPEGAVVVPANLAIVVGTQPKKVLAAGASLDLKGATQTHHYALQSAHHVLAVPSYSTREGLYDRGAWVYWTTK